MPEALGLMQAVLGPGSSLDEAEQALTAALSAEIDPLHWCAIHRKTGAAEIMRRAAAWADMAYAEAVPRVATAEIAPARLESLTEIRIFRFRLLDRDVAFASPDFFGVLRLKRLRFADPNLRQRICLVPEKALRDSLVGAAQEALMDGARQTLARSWPYAAAQLDLTKPVRWAFAALFFVLPVLLLAAPLTGQVWLLPIWALLVILPTVLRCAALLAPAPGGGGADQAVADEDLPVYSVLVPLRDEANMVEQLFRCLGGLDYPADRLQVVFVVEGRSAETVEAVRSRLGDARFSLLVVPDAPPRTKPKALDFALPLCRGEFVVVYDAEDRPEPGQLRDIVGQFRREPDIECIQARLVIANGDQGFLPALFAGEYAGLFTVILPALARWNIVMPLGGTSNHFRLATLRGIGGWDAYNVTEDADLGVRLARRRMRTATSMSATLEDAPVAFRPWLGQRTRWMKGWIQTYVVHTRRPVRLFNDLGWRGLLLFQILILGMLLAPLLHAGFLAVYLALTFTGQAGAAPLGPWMVVCLTVLFFGYGSAIAANLLGLARSGQGHLGLAQTLLPVYWLFVTLAMVLAIWDFVRRPFHWFKTPHRQSAPPPGDQQ